MTKTHLRATNHATFFRTSSGYVRRGKRPEARTLCGAPVTDRDENAGYWMRLSARKREAYPEPMCPACIAAADNYAVVLP